MLDGENRAVVRASWRHSDLHPGRNGIDSELGRVSSCKVSFAIIQEHGYQLMSPRRNENQVKSAVAINVPREQHQSSGGPGDAYRLRPALAELKRDPIARMQRIEAGDLHYGAVRLAIPVEVADGKLRVRYGIGRTLRLRFTRASAGITTTGHRYLRNREQAAHGHKEVSRPLPGPLQSANNRL